MARGRFGCARARLVLGVATGVATALLVSGCAGGNAKTEAKEGTTTQPASAAADAEPTPATADAEPTSVSPPANFTAEAGTFEVVLTWDAPAGESEVERYTIYRDGSPVSSFPGSEHSLTDDRLAPATRYSYEIEAQSGELVSDRIAVRVKTRTPPLRAARVEGIFKVRTRVLSASGYVEHKAPKYNWQFRPRCRKGACDLRWNDFNKERVRALLDREGASYRGTYTGFFNVFCSDSRVTSSVTVNLRVAAARPINNEWAATRLVGTLSQSEASQLGCVSSRAELSIRARLVL